VHSVGHRRDLPTLWNYTRGVVRQAGRDGAGYFWRGKELAAAARRVLVSSPINEGDSGGPLVNDRGELVGVLAAVRWQAPGVSVAIDRGEVLALLAAASKEPPGPAPPGKDGEDDLYPRLLAAAAWVRPSATNEHISAWVWDRGRKLLVTTASGAGPDDLVSVVFPLFDGDELIPEEAAYRSGFRLRRAGVWVRGWVLARDPVRDLALIEVEALPERSRTLRLAEQPVPVGGRVHTIGHLSGVDLLWLYGRGAVRQRAGLRLGTGEDDPPLRVTILQLGRRAGAGGGPVVNDRGEVVGMLTGKGAPNQDAEYAVERQEIAAFLKQTKPLWDPSTAADWLRRGDYFLRRGRPGAAAYAYREAVRHEPGSAPARCGLAEAYRRLGRPDEALAECGRAIELAPDSPEGYVRRARVLLDLGRADEAAEDAARAVRIDPKCAEAYAVRGETLLRRGERGAALDDCREALWLAPNLAAAYSLRARLNDTPLGQEQRRLDLDRVLALDPFERAARWQRADDLLRRKEWKKAKADLLRLAESDPADAAPLLRLAAAHLELGETGPALEALGEALWRRPAQ
ncbi:MAG TPA: tetratricopeptide repeat protein, partial [Gemmataceae bacterium]